MSKEVQKSFEDYLELEEFIEQLRLQRPASPPANLTPQQARIHGMAKLLHVASQPTADPCPEFKAQLYQRLWEQMPTEDQFPPPSFQSHMEVTGLQGNQLLAQALDADHVGKGTTGTGSVPPPTVPSQRRRQFRNISRSNRVGNTVKYLTMYIFFRLLQDQRSPIKYSMTS